MNLRSEAENSLGLIVVALVVLWFLYMLAGVA